MPNPEREEFLYQIGIRSVPLPVLLTPVPPQPPPQGLDLQHLVRLDFNKVLDMPFVASKYTSIDF